MRYPKSFFALFILVALFISKPLFSQSKDQKIDSSVFNNLVFFHQFKTDTISINYKKDFIEKLFQLKTVSGTMRLSGAGFAQVASIDLKRQSLRNSSIFLNRCVSGSKITFENTVFKTEAKTTKFINKSIFIQ